MQIWFVVYFFAHLLSYAGPFPRMEQCEQAVVGFNASWPDHPASVVPECEERTKAPTVGEPLPIET